MKHKTIKLTAAYPDEYVRELIDRNIQSVSGQDGEASDFIYLLTEKYEPHEDAVDDIERAMQWAFNVSNHWGKALKGGSKGFRNAFDKVRAQRDAYMSKALEGKKKPASGDSRRTSGAKQKSQTPASWYDNYPGPKA